MGAEQRRCKRTWQRTQRTDSAFAYRRWSTRIKPATQRRWKLQNPRGRRPQPAASQAAAPLMLMPSEMTSLMRRWDGFLFFFLSLDRRLSRTHKKRIEALRESGERKCCFRRRKILSSAGWGVRSSEVSRRTQVHPGAPEGHTMDVDAPYSVTIHKYWIVFECIDATVSFSLLLRKRKWFKNTSIERFHFSWTNSWVWSKSKFWIGATW